MKVRKKRRTKSEITEDLFLSALQLIEENGFLNTTLTGIARDAGIEPVVFYNRFETLSDFLDEFVKKYDYWFSDIIKEYDGELYSKEGYLHIFNRLFSSLQQNKVMQHLLRWELAAENATTVRTARLREEHTLPLVEDFSRLFKLSSIDIGAVSSLMVGGIYYLTLHSRVSTFSGIDLNTEEGRQRILSAINYLADIFFSERLPKPEKIEIAEKLKRKGVSCEIIAECTGISVFLINEL